jgi:hypothetical protein
MRILLIDDEGRSIPWEVENPQAQFVAIGKGGVMERYIRTDQKNEEGKPIFVLHEVAG